MKLKVMRPLASVATCVAALALGACAGASADAKTLDGFARLNVIGLVALDDAGPATALDAAAWTLMTAGLAIADAGAVQ